MAFTNQPNFVIDSGMHLSFHPNCHYQHAFSKLDSETEYQQLYELLVWDYKNTTSESISKATEMFNSEKLFQNKNNLDHLKHFNKTIVYIVCK